MPAIIADIPIEMRKPYIFAGIELYIVGLGRLLNDTRETLLDLKPRFTPARGFAIGPRDTPTVNPSLSNAGVRSHCHSVSYQNQAVDDGKWNIRLWTSMPCVPTRVPIRGSKKTCKISHNVAWRLVLNSNDISVSIAHGSLSGLDFDEHDV